MKFTLNQIKPHSRLDLIFIIIFILICVVGPLFYISSIRLWDDEAAYLVIGDSISKGSVLYRDVADVKSPGTYYLAALVITVVGKSLIAARILACVFQAASAILIFVLGTKIIDKKIGMTASILYLIAAYITIFQGYYFMAEPFAVFFSLLSVLYFFKNDLRYYFLAGIFLGIGVLFKQTTILLFGVFLLFYLLRLRFKNNRTKDYVLNSTKILITIFLGVAVPLALVFLYFYIMGAADEMLYYTILFLTEYKLPFIPMIMIYGFSSYLPVWLLFSSMLLFIGYNFLKGKTFDEKHLFLAIWALILLYPALTIILNQRVLFAVPPMSLLAALLIRSIYQNLKSKQASNQLKSFIISIFLITTGIAAGANISLYTFSIEAYGLEDQIQDLNEIEQYVDGKVHIFPNDNKLFFFSNLTPNVKYIGHVFSEEMAEQVVNDLEINNVSYIVGLKNFVNQIEEKKIGASNPRIIIYDYIQTHYDILTTTNSSIIYKLKG